MPRLSLDAGHPVAWGDFIDIQSFGRGLPSVVFLSCSSFCGRWWGRGDSNSHAFQHMILNHARLPVPTLPPCALSGGYAHAMVLIRAVRNRIGPMAKPCNYIRHFADLSTHLANRYASMFSKAPATGGISDTKGNLGISVLAAPQKRSDYPKSRV